MAPNGLYCADVPLSNYSLAFTVTTHSPHHEYLKQQSSTPTIHSPLGLPITVAIDFFFSSLAPPVELIAGDFHLLVL